MKRSRRTLATLMTQKLSSADQTANFVDIWKKFCLGGLTGEFLTRLILWKDQCDEDDPIFPVVNEGYKILLQDNDIPNPASKIVLGCLSAIKGIHFKAHANTVLTHILSSSHSIEHQLLNLPRASYLPKFSEATNSLLSNSQSVSELEKIFQDDFFNLQINHNHNTPLPFHPSSSETRVSSKNLHSRDRDVSPSYEGNLSSPRNLKLVANLTLKSFEIFPSLLYANFDSATVTLYIQELIENGNALSAAK
jgi:hypothetical protein